MRIVSALSALTLVALGCTSPHLRPAPPRLEKNGVASAKDLADVDPALNPRIVRLRHYCSEYSTNAVAYEEEPPFSSGYLFEVIAPGSQKGQLLHLHDCSAPWEKRRLFARVGHLYLLHVSTTNHVGSTSHPLPEVPTNTVQYLCNWGWRALEIR